MKTYKKIIKDYSDKYIFKSSRNSNTFTSLFRFGIIIVPLTFDIWDSNDSLFELLHEIGHCETYQEKQRRCYMEFLATQWAIGQSKKYKISISDTEKQEWQDYINSFTKAKDKSKYKLDWTQMD